MSDDINVLRNMLMTFRVSELRMLLGSAGRNKSGRKNELQQRAIELLNVPSLQIQQKIKELYLAIRLNRVLNNTQPTRRRDVSHSNIINCTVTPQTITKQQVSIYSHQTNVYEHSQQNLVTNIPAYNDASLKRFPYFDVIVDILKPSPLEAQIDTMFQRRAFYFRLTPQQATDLMCSRVIRQNLKIKYIKQVQLRLLETTCDQVFNLFSNISVEVNGEPCHLPNVIPINKSGVTPTCIPRLVNITRMIKLNPMVTNTIHVSWDSDYGCRYVIAVALVHKRTTSELLQRLKSRGVNHSDHTRRLIKEKLNEDANSDVVTTSLRVSLMCPLGKIRMFTPCRSINCQHLQCFDAFIFLRINKQYPSWTCPVCDKPALYDDLVIDGYFQEVLASCNKDISEIYLHKDGSWSSQVENTATATTKEVVIDLTRSNLDDDEPLAKRRALNP